MPTATAQRGFHNRLIVGLVGLATAGAGQSAAPESEPGPAQEAPVNFLSFASGTLPVGLAGDAAALKIGDEHALQLIDGDPTPFVLGTRPGSAQTAIEFVLQLPAATTFTGFAIPNVLETPSPSQTFVRDVEIAGSRDSVDGPYLVLAQTRLVAHRARGQQTDIPAKPGIAVRWVRIRLSGGLDPAKDTLFLEFSEMRGHGSQAPVPLQDAFTGKWGGRGVRLELAQSGVSVSGCYDRIGDLVGTVSGNVLRATGKTRDAGIPSTFLLQVADDGRLTGVRSTNGSPFRTLTGQPDPQLDTGCATPAARAPGCGAVLHGIGFDHDASVIRPDARPVLDALRDGLGRSPEAAITIVGHSSSEGSKAYNDRLSQQRAEAVVAALAERGIARERLRAEGLGERQPIADNATEAGRSLNRRVEVRCR